MGQIVSYREPAHQPPTLKIFINSGGGSVVSGISSMDTILRTKVPVHTYVDGLAASAATFLSVVGNYRFMSRNSYMLIHQLSSSFWGTYANFEDEKQKIDLMTSQASQNLNLRMTPRSVQSPT